MIDSYGHSTPATFEQTLVVAFATTQGVGNCDRIEVATWTFSADRASGEVSKTFTTDRFFEASNDNGTVSVCD